MEMEIDEIMKKLQDLEDLINKGIFLTKEISYTLKIK